MGCAAAARGELRDLLLNVVCQSRPLQLVRTDIERGQLGDGTLAEGFHQAVRLLSLDRSETDVHDEGDHCGLGGLRQRTE